MLSNTATRQFASLLIRVPLGDVTHHPRIALTYPTRAPYQISEADTATPSSRFASTIIHTPARGVPASNEWDIPPGFG